MYLLDLIMCNITILWPVIGAHAVVVLIKITVHSTVVEVLVLSVLSVIFTQ